MRFDWWMISTDFSVSLLLILLLLLLHFTSSHQMPTIIYNLADETPAGSLIGNVAENLSPDYALKYTFLLISSTKFQYLSDFFRISPNGDLITLRHIDRDNTNEVCGPLDCCSLPICQTEANVILTKQQWGKREKFDASKTKESTKGDGTDEEALEQHRAGNLNESSEQRMIRLFIRINDANDNPPTFISTNVINQDTGNSVNQLTNRPFIIYIREGDTSGFESLPVASDADSDVNGIVMYKLVEQTSEGVPVQTPRLNISMTYSDFTQKSNGNSVSSRHLNPKLTLLRPLDYENVDDREIYATFYAIDGGDPPLTGSLSIIVRLLDINDNSPTFPEYTEAERLISLPENTTLNYKPFIIVNASDADSGDNGRIVYSFSPLASNLVTSKFNIDSRSAAITIREPLDYEIYSERQFVLPIVAKDLGSPQHSSTTTIFVQIRDINDNVPTLVVQENITIPEGQVFTKPVLRFYVRDEDEVSHGNVICKPVPLEANHLADKELVAGQDFLRLHPVSDTVFFVFTKGVFDYERTPRAALLIECLDSADDVVKGRNEQQHRQLNIIPHEQRQRQQQQQHEQLPPKSHLIRITVAISDQNDNMPIFTQTKYYVKIPEHFHENSLVTEVKADDLDSGEYGELIYQLGDVSTKPNSLKDASNIKNIMNTLHDKQPFQIDQSTGVIKVLHNDLLDREQTEFLYLPIIAKDKGGLTATAQLIVELIDINDNPPKLVSSTDIKVEENQKINTIIDSIHIIDLDKGKHSRIHLMLTHDGDDDNGDDVDGNKLINKEITKYVKMIPDSRFNYSMSTLNELISDGDIKALLISRMPFDRETTASVFYEIVCYDEGQPIRYSVTHTITIHVTDQNDNTPVCTYPIYNSLLGYHHQPNQPHPNQQPVIHINTPLHTLVTQIRGYDPDQGLNGTITYHLDKSTNGSQYFYVNQTTGELFTNWSPNFSFRQTKTKTSPKRIDEPVVGVYQIRVLLRDMGTPSLSKETQFYVKINPFNPSLSKWSTVEALDAAHQTIGSVPMNSKLQKIWFNNRFILILLIIFIIILMITIFGIVFWARSHRKQKLCRSVKTIISDRNVCSPVIMPTERAPASVTLRNGAQRHNETLPILTYDGVADKSPIISHQPSHLLSAYTESEQKFDGNDNNNISSNNITKTLVNTSNIETLNQFSSLWPDTSSVNQYTERNVGRIDRHSTYSHFSLSSDHNNNNNNNSSNGGNKNNYNIHQQTGTLNHLHTNPVFSFPLAYNTYHSSTMNDGGGHRLSVGQKFINSSTYSSTNPYYSASNNTGHNTLNSIGYNSDIVGYNNNTGNTMRERNTVGYLNSPQQKQQVHQSGANSEHYYPHLPIIPDRDFHDQNQNQNETVKFW